VQLDLLLDNGNFITAPKQLFEANVVPADSIDLPVPLVIMQCGKSASKIAVSEVD